MSAETEIPQRPTRSLNPRVAVVTGAGSLGDGIGNGRASAILLAEAGATVLCVDLKLELAERTVQMIEADGHKGKAIAVQADVTDESDARRVMQTAVEGFGRLDILVNVVGVGGAQGTAVEVDMVEWAKGMEVNVGSMVIMAKYAIPEMIKSGGEQWKGSIVNIASVAGLRGGNPHLLYPTSKGAIVNMTRAMASHHAEQGIRVNCVCPGMVYTPMMYGPGMTPEARESRKNRSLLKVEGTGWDVGAAVRFLAGDEARWITGHILTVDAGATVRLMFDAELTQVLTVM
ncbi:NAD(P)-binding protein [Teratosphaeria nubilosa]|uniref:NAD(P)-binding protein n=1 Tax=Teratosphaeria nubilosa TaxID=161662 RepID=A0A6G1LF98_9PEZI|nr:NAD(P)-binding protein [Teratosphaeria nubilosa]